MYPSTCSFSKQIVIGFLKNVNNLSMHIHKCWTNNNTDVQANAIKNDYITVTVVWEAPPVWGSAGSTEKNDGTDSRSWSAERYYSYWRCLEKTSDRKDCILVPI